ncbi:MAG TPA: ISL3 family transposase, partial [Candidatus Acidoferrales bacterium]|nr:ISL3 family transposase [Candidatus Acidoferrales bacterium]
TSIAIAGFVTWFTLEVFFLKIARAMELITILNQCYHFPRFVYRYARFGPDKKTIEIAVRPREGSAAICSGCQKPAPGYDHLPERRFEFIPLWGFWGFFLYRMRRVNCRRCGVVVEQVPWGDGKYQSTKAPMLFLARWARKLSWKETAAAFRTSWDRVRDAVEYVVHFGLEHPKLESVRAIGVDEIQYAKGHKYLTLVYQIDQGITRLLWVGKERTIESLQGFFSVIGEKLASQIEFVCSDMWPPYLDVIREKCSQALHILDRFHIVANMNKALDEVRAAEAREMARAGHEPLLKRTRGCVLKRKDNLTPQQKFRLRDLLRYNLRTVRADLLQEDFQQLWEYDSPTWAGMFLDFWGSQTMRSRIEPMKKIARTLRKHRALILNYFKAKKEFSSGVVEGMNNKAKVTMRKSYGFRTFPILELALYHSLGKLPEPELAHEFF